MATPSAAVPAGAPAVAPSGAGASGGRAATSAPSSPKRPRLTAASALAGLRVHLEPNLGASASRAHEVFADGTYAPADTSHFARASAAASSFVSRAIDGKEAAAAWGSGGGEGGGAEAGASGDAELAGKEAGGGGGGRKRGAGVGGGGAVEPDGEWTGKVIAPIEGAMAELGRAVHVIEALRAEDPLLELKRYRPVGAGVGAGRGGAGGRLPAETLRVGGALLMSKRRALEASADMLDSRAAAFKEWMRKDKDYGIACIRLRAACGGLRRLPDGTPLMDVGDGNFVPMERPPALAQPRRPQLSNTEPLQGGDMFEATTGTAGVAPGGPESGAAVDGVALAGASSASEAAAVTGPPVVLHTPVPARVAFSTVPVGQPLPTFESSDSPGETLAASIEGKSEITECDMQAQTSRLIRRIRLARLAAFRQLTFEKISREACNHAGTLDLATNSISVECNPSHIIHIRRTLNPSVADRDCMETDWKGEKETAGAVSGDRIEGKTSPCSAASRKFMTLQNSCLLNLAALQTSIQNSAHASELSEGDKIISAVESVASGRQTISTLERALDSAAHRLRVVVEWSRGDSVHCEATARVWASSLDGDGPSRLLASFEPISDANNDGNRGNNGHVRVLPAFGVVIPAPDDPAARSRVAMPTSSGHGPNTTSQPLLTYGLDDVPRPYLCPVSSGEIFSVLALLLCVRLLDALEAAARSGEAAVVDVDRQCFSVVVLAPKTARMVRAKVWPRGNTPGAEEPSVTVWMDDQRVESFPETANGRVRAWRKLLREIATATPPVGAAGASVGASATPVGPSGIRVAPSLLGDVPTGVQGALSDAAVAAEVSAAVAANVSAAAAPHIPATVATTASAPAASEVPAAAVTTNVGAVGASDVPSSVPNPGTEDVSAGITAAVPPGMGTSVPVGLGSTVPGVLDGELTSGVASAVGAGAPADVPGMAADVPASVAADIFSDVATGVGAGAPSGIPSDVAAGMSAGLAGDVTAEMPAMLSTGMSAEMPAGMAPGILPGDSSGAVTDSHMLDAADIAPLAGSAGAGVGAFSMGDVPTLDDPSSGKQNENSLFLGAIGSYDQADPDQ